MSFVSSLVRSAVRDVLRPTVKGAAGVSVRYHSAASGNVYEVIATLANTSTDGEDLEGVFSTQRLQDFKIDTEELPVQPQDRDRIEWQLFPDADPTWWQVLPESGSREVESNDNYQIAWLIHTKRISDPAMDILAYGDANGEAYGDLNGEAYGGPGN